MSKIRVLLVDDEEDYVKAMAERMDMRDLQSQVALSGAEALQVLNTDPPDVIVLDLRMPGMHGMEVLEKVKKDHPHTNTDHPSPGTTADDKCDDRADHDKERHNGKIQSNVGITHEPGSIFFF